MQPKKSLGQNFLTSEAAIFKMIVAAKISHSANADAKHETVIEIGPGKGVLTKALLAADAHVVAIEKDHRLIEELETKFADEISHGSLRIVEGDALEINPEDLFKGENTKNFDQKPEYKVVANIPYYITGQILRKYLSGKIQPKSMVILLQKEVVDRIVANDKKESILSISIKAYGEPKKIGVVNRGSFFPAPNVDSAIIAIENISKKFFTGSGETEKQIDEDKFFNVLKAGFAHKRKVLISNLAEAEIAPKEKIEKIFETIGLEKNIRAEDLTPEDWRKITEGLSN